MKEVKVVAIIILYYPDLINLKRSIEALVVQVDNIILIDNTPRTNDMERFLSGFDSSVLQYYFLGKNEGVAKAQNIGIKYALEKSCEFVLIMDQDSVAAEDMVCHLINDFNFLNKERHKIAVIGPTPINVQTQEAYSPRIKKNYPFVSENHNILKVSELISSGSLINFRSIQLVGLMDEYLFIDGVDHEWCWRAKYKGLSCAMSKNAKLEHMLGEGDRKLFGIRLAITSPFRVFYQYRNYFYLCKKEYVPLYWKLNNGFKYLIKIFYYPIFVSPRILYLKNILEGIKAGLVVNK